MSYTYFAFFMGLFGSIHCAVMCGPLIFAIEGRQGLGWTVFLNKLFYQLGRILTYGLLGFLIGTIGNFAQIQGWQRSLSWITGGILLLIAIFQILGKNYQTIAGWQTKAVQPIVSLLSKWLYRPGGSFIAGVLNGLLPCGMVYMALMSSMNAASPQQSFLFMLCFGLGTIPLLFLFSFLGNFSRSFKIRFSKWIPFLYFLLGVWFILRGANLDIPYLSPLIHIDGAINCA
ncbi:sulfite exporter TauE/SafE family protein [Sphingobacterium sp. N143]|uniref:sulfite exporter TauE/SafE family protein n=1 Tax=Sphingobacterium sp. N143 TaxID=2746727 RepID=UPI002575880E|nr:sulfite exporter TauE/SafE family protein [Sphingobacterium sp. N143]MDM1294421.1 sulfite exporter TauE/SafE family protein [Sphingobacterium sp. N143]